MLRIISPTRCSPPFFGLKEYKVAFLSFGLSLYISTGGWGENLELLYFLEPPLQGKLLYNDSHIPNIFI